MRPNPRTYSGKWIRSLLAAGLVPVIRLVEEVGEEWPERERFWIEHYSAQGCQLTNLAEGGHGPSGFSHSPEAKARISAALRSRHRTKETNSRIAASLRQHVVTEETKAKIAAATKSHFESDERKQKQSEATRRFLSTEAGKLHLAKMEKNKVPASEETRLKLSQAGKLRYASPEERTKQSERIKAASASPESKAKRSEAQKRRWARIRQQ